MVFYVKKQLQCLEIEILFDTEIKPILTFGNNILARIKPICNTGFIRFLRYSCTYLVYIYY
jgi:hypothetical protein